MIMADHGINAHEMIHMGVSDKQGIDRLQHALCQMMNLAAVDENASTSRPGIEEEHRVVQKPREKGGLEISERQPGAHVSLLSAALQHPWRGRSESGRR